VDTTLSAVKVGSPTPRISTPSTCVVVPSSTVMPVVAANAARFSSESWLPGTKQVRHVDVVDEPADARLERAPVRGEVARVEHGVDVEAVGQLLHQLDPERVRVEVATWRIRVSPVATPLAVAAYRPDTCRDSVCTRPLTPVEVADRALRGGEDRRCPLERPLEAGLVEGVGVVAVPGPQEGEPPPLRATGGAEDGVGQAPVAHERAGDAPRHRGDEQRTQHEPAEQAGRSSSTAR
jgi:hypothetical protein